MDRNAAAAGYRVEACDHRSHLAINDGFDSFLEFLLAGREQGLVHLPEQRPSLFGLSQSCLGRN